MIRTVTIKDQELLILPKAGGSSVLWYGQHRIELSRTELTDLAAAFADVATTPQMEAVA